MLDNRKTSGEAIFHVMREEYNRLCETERFYQDQIRNLPQGSLQRKRIRHGDYLYLARRIGRRVVYHYIGAAGSEKAQQVLAQIDKRRRFALLLQEVRRDLQSVRRVLRGRI